jgi:hypothetical protein
MGLTPASPVRRARDQPFEQELDATRRLELRLTATTNDLNEVATALNP